MSPLEETAKAHFLAGYKKPTLSILHESGLYRHIKIKGGDFHSFDLVTWPYHLFVNCEGDKFTFSRIDDMFQFFLFGESDDHRIEPNFSYWAEKLSDPRSPMVRGFSFAKFERDVEERLSNLSEERANELRREMRDELYQDDEGSCHEFAAAHSELRDLARDCQWSDWTHRYAYACFAIQFGIREYRRAKSEMHR